MIIASLNISEKKGTKKMPVPSMTLDLDGIVGDAHRGPWHRQVSLLSRESIDAFIARSGRHVDVGEFAENITTQGLDLKTLKVGDRIEIAEVILEVTQIGKECHGTGCEIFKAVGVCAMPKEGIFTRVIRGGTLRVGDAISIR